jgi:hypothetical protein
VNFSELETRLQMAADLIERLVDARPDDPHLMANIDNLRRDLEAKAPEHVGMIRDRIQCLLGSLGLIP